MSLALLRIEVETLWTCDAVGRLVWDRVPEGGRPAPLLVVMSAGGGHFAATSSVLPERCAEEVAGLAAGSPLDAAGTPSTAAELRARVEEAAGPTIVGGGPSYVIPPATTYACNATIERSMDADAEALRGRMPDEDVDGTCGPYAVAVVDGVVASICCTARRSEVGAEAGVWTYEPFRRRGYAATVAAAWAELLHPDLVRFYSTHYTNHSSQAVARRLGLPQIGWMWKIEPAPVDPATSRSSEG